MISEPAPSPDREQLLDEVLAAHLESEERGETPDRAELLARHPELADELAAFFADQDRFGCLVGPLSDSTSHPATSFTDTPRDGMALRKPPVAGQHFGDYELLGE